MIEIDKNDFLYKHLQALGVDNVDALYLEFASNGIATMQDFKKHLYRQYGDDFNKEIDESELDKIVDFYGDVKKSKKVNKIELNKLLKQFKKDGDNKKLDIIINSKLNDVIFIACMYSRKYKDVLIEDILQTCNIGLLKAIEKYNEKSRISFDEYVEFWISEEIKENYSKEKNNG